MQLIKLNPYFWWIWEWLKRWSKRVQPGIWGTKMHIEPFPEKIWKGLWNMKYSKMARIISWGKEGIHSQVLKDHIKLPGQCELLTSPYLISVIPDLGFWIFRHMVLFSLSMTQVVFHLTLALLFCLPFAANLDSFFSYCFSGPFFTLTPFHYLTNSRTP